jgi:hypothetical protein
MDNVRPFPPEGARQPHRQKESGASAEAELVDLDIGTMDSWGKGARSLQTANGRDELKLVQPVDHLHNAVLQPPGLKSK